MGYLTNSGSGFLSNAVTTVSNVKSYLVNKTGYLVDSIRVGIGDFGQRVLDDGGTVEASAEAAASYREITKDIYDQASLVLFPSGYKDNLLYSHKPVNGSGDFTYTRGTDTATRVGADGYIKKERANLLVQSNQFDTTWSLSGGSTLSQNAVGIDNIPNTAWTFTKDSTFDGIKQNISKSGINTFSVYAKKIDSSVNELVLRINVAGGNRIAIFDLSNGTKVSMTSDSSAVHYDIQKAGNGWYRCSFVVSGTIANVDIRMDYNQTGTGSMLVQNAQLEEGLVATPYIETTTAPVYEGLTDNLPRIDYTGGTPSILLEPSRTNQVQNSEYYESYATTSASISSNVATSLEGLSNAAELVEDSSNDNHFFRIPNLSWTSGNDVVFSIYLKENTRRYARLRFDATGGNTRAWLDLRTGVTTLIDNTDNGVCTSTDVGNGWFRYEFKVTPSNTSAAGSVQIFTQSVESVLGSLQTAYQGDGTSGIYVWGAQVEQGSYATSYIPTYGSSATRNVDNMQIASGISDLLPQGTGTMYVEATIVDAVDTESYLMRIEQANFSNTIFITRSTTGNLVVSYRNNNSTLFSIQKNNVADTFKAAFAFESGNSVFYVNGERVGTSSVTYTPSVTYDDIRIGGFSANAANMSGLFSQGLVFKTRLTNEELAALTAL